MLIIPSLERDGNIQVSSTAMIQTAKLSVAEYHQIVEAGILGDRRIELLEGRDVQLKFWKPKFTEAKFSNSIKRRGRDSNPR